MEAPILESPMIRQRRRKCRHCGQLYEPDFRNLRHQQYCSQPACRHASKAASQACWQASPKGRDYFRGSVNTLRVQTWRQAHPGYWKRPGARRRKKSRALQDHCLPQVIVPPMDKPDLGPRALQDIIIAQGFAITGLVAHFTDCALQENIASTTQRLILLGQQIQGPNAGKASYGRGQESAVSPASAASPAAVQLDRPPPG